MTKKAPNGCLNGLAFAFFEVTPFCFTGYSCVIKRLLPTAIIHSNNYRIDKSAD